MKLKVEHDIFCTSIDYLETELSPSESNAEHLCFAEVVRKACTYYESGREGRNQLLKCRTYKQEDYQFLREMLFEAVFWSRSEEDRPSLEEGLSYDYTKHVLIDFGKRKGDIAVIAEIDGERAGAAFIRYWNDSENIRGYLSEDVPVLVIGVAEGFRNQGVGSALLKSLKNESIKNGILKISLCVTKTNVAYQLYKKQDFKIVEDIGDSYNMLWEAEDSLTLK